ncbi:MAG: hypothetical protein HY556_01440 [Euryarchaeota archaeon]|nr:hypothetical protein [Euryarchaeota archaeon]
MFLAALCLGTGSILGLNYFVNPHGDFSTQYFQPYARNDAYAKIALFHAMKSAPETLILGSSKAMTFAPTDYSEFTGRSAFNFALPGGKPGDYLAIYRYAVASGRAPAHILLALEDSELTYAIGRDAHPQVLATPPLAAQLPEAAAAVAATPTDDARLLMGSFSARYLRDSLKVLAGFVLGTPVLSGEYAPDGYSLRDFYGGRGDGVKTPAEVLAKRVASMVDSRDELLSRIVDPRPVNDTSIGRLSYEARSAGVNVSIIMTPVHPALLAAMDTPKFNDAHYAMIVELKSLCQIGIRLYDFTSVETFGGDPGAFFDGIHVERPNTRAMLGVLSSESGELCAKLAES